ncbi:MAG: WG repeat-containing protein [Defluviitaleaceae bacterium]|nr:WG repeat-containing protein [Defluviitaleaceae bacterium]
MRFGYCMGFAVIFAVVLVLSSCGREVEQAEYYRQEVTATTPTESSAPEAPWADFAWDETPYEETTPEALPLASLVLYEVAYRDGLIHVMDNHGRRGLLDGRGNMLLPFKDNVSFGEHNEERIGITIGADTGFMNTATGEWVIPPSLSIDSRFSSVGTFHNGEVMLHLADGWRGIANLDGEWVYGPVQSNNWGFAQQDDEFRVDRIDEGGVVVNAEGEIVFPLEHMEAYHLVDQIGWDSRWGISMVTDNLIFFGSRLFDLGGNQLFYPEDGAVFNHSHAWLHEDVVVAFFTDVLCQVSVDNTTEYRLFDLQGNQITSRYYTSIGRFAEGLLPVQVGRPGWNGFWPEEHEMADVIAWDEFYIWDDVFWGLINALGDYVIPPMYWYVSAVNNGRVRVFSPEGFALFNTAGEIVIPFEEYGSIAICDQGFVIVGAGGIETPPSDQLKGLVDIDGNEISPLRYNIIRSYRPDYLFSWGWEHLLIEAGVFATIPPRWLHEDVNPETVSIFKEGRAAVAYGGLWGYIDMYGYEIIPTQFVYAGTFMDGVALVNVGGTRARPHTWQQFWRDHIADTRHYSAFGGVWHLIDIYGNILDTFEHEYMVRLNANIIVYSNNVSLGDVYDITAGWRNDPMHVGGRFSPLWDENGFISLVNECAYITLVQMDIRDFGIIL